MDHIKYCSTRIKELEFFLYKLAKVRLNENEEIKKYVNIANHLISSNGSIQAPETILFNRFNLSKKIIIVAKNASSKKCIDINAFISNIILVGGVAKTNGLVDKLKMDIQNQYRSANIVCRHNKYTQIEGAYTAALLEYLFSDQ